MQLVIGNKNYSSWSLRAWLYLTEAGVAFDEVRIPLFTEGDWRERILRYNPSGRVPALVDGDVRVWDSWAIIEHVRHRHEVLVDWPDDATARGEALSVAAEMHAGFLGLRNELPMNIRASAPGRWTKLSDGTKRDVDRIRTIWTGCLERHAGPYLFGDTFTIADVLYAPVASRFRTYGIELDEPSRRYVQAVFDRPGMATWCEQARAETERIAFIDALADDTPLNPR